MAWNFGVLDKDSRVRMSLEEMEKKYAGILKEEAAKAQTLTEQEEQEEEYDER